MANEANVKVLSFFSEETVRRVNATEVSNDIISSVVSGSAVEASRERKKYPDKQFCIVIDAGGFFVGSQVYSVSSVDNTYHSDKTMSFCVGQIIDDGRIVIVKFTQLRAWHPSFWERRRRKKASSRYETMVVQKDGVVPGARRFVEMTDVDVLGESAYCRPLHQDSEDEKKAALEWRREQLGQTVIKNFDRLPESGREIVGKSRDIIREALAADDAKE